MVQHVYMLHFNGMIHLIKLTDQEAYMSWIFIKDFGSPLFGFNRDNATETNEVLFFKWRKNYDQSINAQGV